MTAVVTLKFPGGSGKVNFQEEVVNLVNEIFTKNMFLNTYIQLVPVLNIRVEGVFKC